MKKDKAIPQSLTNGHILAALKEAKEAAEAMQAAQAVIQELVDTLEPNQQAMEAAQVAIQAAQATMQGAQAAIQAAQVATQGKVDAVDGKVNGVADQVAVVDGKADGLATQASGIEAKVDAADAKVVAIDVKVDGIDGGIIDLETKAVAVDAKVDGVSAQATVVEGKVDDVAAQATAIDSAIAAMATFVATMSARIGALRINVTKTLVQGVEPIHVNLFSFDKPFVILGIFGVVTRVGNSVDIDDCFFNAADDVAMAEITKDALGGGADLSGCVVGSLISKEKELIEQAVLHLANAVGATDTKWNPSMCQVTAKNGVPNYIRFTYDSDPLSGLDIDINFIMWYQQIDDENPAIVTEA